MLLLVVMFGAAVGSLTGRAQASFSGANTFSVSLSDVDLTTFTMSEAVTLSFRYGRFSASSRTTMGNVGLLGQSFRVSGPLGDLSLQGSASFTSEIFSRADVSVSGRWSGVSYGATFLLAELGDVQSSSIGMGMTLRGSGTIEGLGRVTTVLGLGASPFGQVHEGCNLTYEGLRLSLTNVELCGGTAAVDVIFGQTGLESESASWSARIPFLNDYTVRVYVRFSELFSYESTSVGIGGMVGDLSVNGSFAYDDTEFLQGSWSLSGPFLEGRLSTTASFDSTTLLALSFNWARTFEFWSINITPAFEILELYDDGIRFDIPSIQATFRFDLACCLGQPSAELGDLIVTVSASESGFDRISLTHQFPF